MSTGMERRQFLSLAGKAALVAGVGSLAGGALAGCSTPQSAKGGGAKGKTKIKYWDWWTPSSSPSFQTYFDWLKSGFEAKNPNIQVEMQFVPFDSYQQKLITAFASGEAPDVFHCSVGWATDLWRQGVLLQLDSFISGAKEVQKDQFVASGWLYNNRDGKTFGIPMEGPDTDVIGFNVDVLKAAGLDTSFEAMPTWNDFLTYARKLTIKNADGSFKQAAFQVSDFRGFNDFVSWNYANGGKLYKPDFSGVEINAKNGVEVIEWYRQLLYQEKVSAAPSANQDLLALLLSGQAAMVFSGSYNAQNLKDQNANFNFGYFPIPTGPSGSKRTARSWCNMTVLSKAPKNQEAAWTFARFNASHEVALKKIEIIKRYGPRLDVLETKVWKDKVAEIPALANTFKVAEGGQIGAVIKGAELTKAITPFLGEAVLGQRDPKDALAQAQKAADAIKL